MKFLLLSIMIMNDGTIERGNNHPGFEFKQHSTIEECIYHKFQNHYTMGSLGMKVQRVFQYCIVVEERSA